MPDEFSETEFYRRRMLRVAAFGVLCSEPGGWLLRVLVVPAPFLVGVEHAG
jgi:hypothetical protein